MHEAAGTSANSASSPSVSCRTDLSAWLQSRGQRLRACADADHHSLVRDINGGLNDEAPGNDDSGVEANPNDVRTHGVSSTALMRRTDLSQHDNRMTQEATADEVWIELIITKLVATTEGDDVRVSSRTRTSWRPLARNRVATMTSTSTTGMARHVVTSAAALTPVPKV